MGTAWYSPWSVGPELEQQLARCGWKRWTADRDDLPDDAVLLYQPPDQVLARADGQLDAGNLLAGYQQLLGCSKRLISAWRLQACSEAQLRRGVPEALEVAVGFPQPDGLAALITRQLLDATPGLLDAYLDLELKADLLGGEPDVHYRKRLVADLDADALLAAWRDPQGIQEQLSEARDEAELILLQLHQVQEELEHYFLLSRSQASQLERYEQLLRRGEGLLSRALSLQPVG